MLNDLVAKIDDYLDGNASLQQFKEWFFHFSFDLDRKFSGSVVDLVHEIEGILAEASSGHWSTAALDHALDSVVSPYRFPRVIVVQVDDDRPRTSISSASLWWELLAAQHSAI